MRYILIALLTLLASNLQAGGVSPVEVGQQKQLLVDDHAIASMEYLTRQLGRVTKENDGHPIFTEGWFYGTVLRDEGKFKMWYRTEKPGGYEYKYAESEDGLSFSTISGLTGIHSKSHTLTVFIDSHETDPDHRFKAAYDGPAMMAAIAHSADGINWTPYNDGNPVTHRAADTLNQILWDEGAQTYRLFTRTDFGAMGGDDEIRGSRGMVNPDVKANPTDWTTTSEWIFDREGEGETKRRQIYGLADWIYSGVHFGLLSVYEWPGDTSEGPTDLVKRHERNIMNCYLATSRDGSDWDLSWVYAGQPIIPRGGDGTFDKDMIHPSSSILTHDDRHWLYYSGGNERHGTKQVVHPRENMIGLASLRLDGFVGLHADDVEGTVVTKPFKLEGGGLRVNVDATEGKIRIDVLDASGNPLEGYSGSDATTFEKVDELRLSPCWSKPLASLKEETIRLRFHLTRAALYSFQVTDE
jgi:hypothetical protein